MLELRLGLESLLISCIDKLTFARYSSALFHRWTVIDSLPPLLEVRKGAEVDASKVGNLEAELSIEAIVEHFPILTLTQEKLAISAMLYLLPTR